MRLNDPEFAELVRQAIESLPEQFRSHLANCSVEIYPRPTRSLMRQVEMDFEENQDLMGLYVGTALPDKRVEDVLDWPERILIFQRNIEDECASRAELLREIRTTVLHEVGHHFGMDEDDLAKWGYE